MHIEKNIRIEGKHGKPIVADIFYATSLVRMPVIIYAHGFNGFKDWGNFDLIAEHFAEQGFAFIKFNFSHGGTTPDQPEDFVDLEGYANNNYTKELDDLAAVIDWADAKENPHATVLNTKKLYLLGHSMGGSMAIVKAAEDSRVKKLVTWSAVSACKSPWMNWTSQRLEQWRETGVDYYENARTHQQMPLNYQLYEDYHRNEDRLNLQTAMGKLNIPVLICHGTGDISVPQEHAQKLHQWKPGSELFLLDADHVYGRRHPWDQPMLPAETNALIAKTIEFLNT